VLRDGEHPLPRHVLTAEDVFEEREDVLALLGSAEGNEQKGVVLFHGSSVGESGIDDLAKPAGRLGWPAVWEGRQASSGKNRAARTAGQIARRAITRKRRAIGNSLAATICEAGEERSAR
jgi:hypothetical protein